MKRDCGVGDKIWQPSEILRRYESGEREFRGLEIESPRGSTGPDFRRAKLAGADFTESFIVADFSGADLQGARFAPANVKTCSFDGADLRNADFSGAAIDAATFDGADLAGAKRVQTSKVPGRTDILMGRASAQVVSAVQPGVEPDGVSRRR